MNTVKMEVRRDLERALKHCQEIFKAVKLLESLAREGTDGLDWAGKVTNGLRQANIGISDALEGMGK